MAATTAARSATSRAWRRLADTAGTLGRFGSASVPGAGVPWSMAQPMRRDSLHERRRSSTACSGESGTVDRSLALLIFT
jgi:hypothetical protein